MSLQDTAALFNCRRKCNLELETQIPSYVRQVNGVKLVDILFSLCVCVCVCEHSYLDANISKTVWDRDLVPITH